jgi:hypothetical protein
LCNTRFCPLPLRENATGTTLSERKPAMPYHFSLEEKSAMRDLTRELHARFYMQKPDSQITMEDAMKKPVKKVQPMRKPNVKESKLALPQATVTKKRGKQTFRQHMENNAVKQPKVGFSGSKGIIIDKALALLTTAGKDGVKFSVLIEKILSGHKDIPKNTIVGVLVSLNSDPRISKPSRGLYVLKSN